MGTIIEIARHNEGMCGRFVLFSTQPELGSAADAADAAVPGASHVAAVPGTIPLLEAVGQWEGVHTVVAPAGLPPARYNIAPTTTIAIVRLIAGQATVEPARWGLVPHWKKDLDGPPLFNARAETVATKPSFRQAYARNRCIIPLDGYYEWHDDGSGKKPYYVTDSTGGLLWAAGLWSTGQDILSATMVTTAATPAMEWLHGRLPKFLRPEELRPWLAGEDLLEPSGVDTLQARLADTAVGNVRNDFPELIAPQP
nr:SOS response-associated peptidase [Corynebacterium lizhenjunii]